MPERYYDIAIGAASGLALIAAIVGRPVDIIGAAVVVGFLYLNQRIHRLENDDA